MKLITRYSKLKTSCGFTLIELLISISIIAVIASVGVINIVNYRNRQNLKINTQKIVEVLRNAQNRSITQENGIRWGVHFENPAGDDNDFFDLFSGAAYNADKVVSRTVVSNGIQFDIPPSGASSTVVFAPLTGFSDVSSAIKISLKNNQSASTSIIINANGQIQY